MADSWPGTRQTIDDGAYDAVARRGRVPAVRLPATTGGELDVVAEARWTVLFLYPATGVAGAPLPEGWLRLPGAYGCTGETCAFRDLAGEFAALGVALRGVSTQTPEEQAAFAAREGIGYPLLSDHEHTLVDALGLPTFTAVDTPPRIRRATLLVDDDRRIRNVLYPVPEPALHPADALELVRAALTDPSG